MQALFALPAHLQCAMAYPAVHAVLLRYDSLCIFSCWGGAHDNRSIVACHKCSLALSDRGLVYAWGSNTDCQLGVEQDANHKMPVCAFMPGKGSAHRGK